MSAGATIKVKPEIKAMLDGLKVHPRESYSDVIGRVVRRAYDPEPLSSEEVAGLEDALADIKAGRIHSEADIKATFGVPRH
jgi:predicted transcriptional regulator